MNLNGIQQHFLICNGSSCVRNGGKEVAEALREEIRHQGLVKKVHTTLTLCNGRCEEGCIVISYPEGIWYKEMNPKRARELIQKWKCGERLDEQVAYLYEDGEFSMQGGDY